MKKIIIRIVVLLLIFGGSMFVVAKLLNRDTPDTTGQMGEATLPLVYMNWEGTQLNCLHGYAKKMDVTTMRDALTPINDNRELTIQIQPYDNKITGVSFEVITADGETSMENTKVNKLEEDENYVTATLQFQNKILINTEYVLQIQVSTGSRDIYYYTRVIQQDGLNAKAYLDFATGFYESCLNGDESDLAEVLEPDDTGDNTTLNFTNIHCSTSQLTWADLDPQVYSKPTPSIRELNATTATIVMDYMISAVNDYGETELYNVSEYYRMRYTQTRIMLLDFERTTQQIFNPENTVLQENGINLGIAGRDIHYKSDEKQNYFAFVREGALWLYEVGTGKMTQVFSFPQQENSDGRDTYGQNEIQIIDIDETGNIYFLVCGYMNRGMHEGEAGVAVYYFDSNTSTIQECLFVDTKQSYALLKRDIQSLAYVSTDRSYFYMMLGGKVYGINMETREEEVIVEGVKANCYAGSGKQFAWLEQNSPYDSTSLQVINLDTRETRTITCQESERIRPIGFMDDDLVYGVADAQDINTEHEGNEVFPMKRIVIVNEAGETVKEYAPEGIYVLEAVISEKLLTLTRATKNGSEFVETTEDHIVSSEADEDASYGLTTSTGTKKQTETILRVGTTIQAGMVPQIVRSQEILYEGSRTITLDPDTSDEELYYVYAKGELDSMYASINTAIQRADETYGVVVDSSQQHIWERGNKKTKIDLDTSRIPQAMLQYNLDPEALQTSMEEKVLDLSGCTLDQVLYFVSEGHAVLAKTPDGAVIIGGYDEYNTRLLYQGKTELEYYGMEDSTALFEEAGNIFLTYW